jgi:DNA-binding NarL/FixJ family response regulator
MASSTATPRRSGNGAHARPIAVESGDAVTQRRIRAALGAAGRLASPDHPLAAGVEESNGADSSVLVLAVDAGDSEAATTVRLTLESSPGVAVVVVTPSARESEVRRVLRAGASGIVFDGQLETTLTAAVHAVAAGFVVVPRTLRRQALKPVFSHREREILGLVADGATNREIADHLFLAESTVKSHLSTAFTKLGVRTRAEAAALVLDPGEQSIHGLWHLAPADTAVGSGHDGNQ